MTERSDDTSQQDQQAQREYGDQPTYHQQSDESAPQQAAQEPQPGYREQDYGGERMYTPDQHEQSQTSDDQR